MSKEDSVPEQRLFGRAGAYESWARTPDRAKRTAPGRAAFEAKFLEEANGDPVRAEYLRKAHFARLSAKSAQSRRRSRENLAIAEAAEAELATLRDAASTIEPDSS